MKTAYDNIYYLCGICERIFDSYGREYNGNCVDISKLLVGYCEKCFKKKLENIKWN
jgi:hypothetical protein